MGGGRGREKWREKGREGEGGLELEGGGERGGRKEWREGREREGRERNGGRKGGRGKGEGEERETGHTYQDSIPKPLNFRHSESVWFDNDISCCCRREKT